MRMFNLMAAGSMIAFAAAKDEGSAPAQTEGQSQAPAATGSDVTAATNAVKIEPKLSIKTMGAKPDMVKLAEEADARYPLVRIIGVARGIKSATGNNGDPVFGLTGQFQGTNLKTGEKSVSGVLYLPGGILELIMDPVEAILNGDDRVAKQAGVKFGLDLFSVKAANPAGYSFSATNLIDTAQVNPLAEIESAVSGTAAPAFPKIGG